MAAGRCAGCGYTSSTRKTELHVLSCPDYLALYREHPDKALDPAAELVRHQTEEDTREVRAERRGRRLTKRYAELERAYAQQTARFASPPDILDDDTEGGAGVANTPPG